MAVDGNLENLNPTFNAKNPILIYPIERTEAQVASERAVWLVRFRFFLFLVQIGEIR